MGVFERFTKNAQSAFENAAAVENMNLGPELLLFGLLGQADGTAVKVLNGLGADVEVIRVAAQSAVRRRRSVRNPGLTPRAKTAIVLAVEAAGEMCDSHVGTEHLLLGLAGDRQVGRLLGQQGVTAEGVHRVIKRVRVERAT